jgi:hypothetical protein
VKRGILRWAFVPYVLSVLLAALLAAGVTYLLNKVGM